MGSSMVTQSFTQKRGKNKLFLHLRATYNIRSYIISRQWLVRVFYFVGILAWLCSLYGFYLFFQHDAFYGYITLPFLLLFSFYYLLSYGINLFYRSFDLKLHRRKVRAYWDAHAIEPPVDIFLPVCGEPLEILRRTFDGAKRIDYSNKTVYVLDDKGNGDVRQMAESHGFIYLSRPDRGWMKKAGNLQYGFERSTGDFIVIFDADFVANPKFLHELMPYTDDPKVAIVQSPQFFLTDRKIHDRSPIEYGAGHVQEDFYRIIQKSRDAFDGAICVGSNAVYRRSSLQEIGGIVQIEHSEDVWTGFRLNERGYAVRYIPLILAVGLCPSDMHAYFHQQHRWCSGSMSLMLSKDFWSSDLTIAQKLCYISGFLYYITHAVGLIFSFQIFFVIFRQYQDVNLLTSFPFYPYMVFTFISLPLFRLSTTRKGAVLAGGSHIFSYGNSVVRSILNIPIAWRPTGAQEFISKEYITTLHANSIYVMMYLGLISVAFALHRVPVLSLSYAPVLFWIVYWLVVNGLVLYYGYKTAFLILDRHAVPTRQQVGWAMTHAVPYAVVAAFLVFLGIAFYIIHPSPTQPVLAAEPYAVAGADR
jgi:cellulose synthase (UDP-forming)